MKSLLQVLDLPIDRIESQLLVVPFFSDQRPLEGPAALLDWRLNGMLTMQMVNGETGGNLGERYLVKANHKIAAEWVMFVGCGRQPQATRPQMQAVVAELIASVLQAGFKRIGLGLPVATAEQLSAWQEVLDNELADRGSRYLVCQFSACDPAAYVN